MSLQRTVYAVRENVSKFLSLKHTNGMLLICIATAVQLWATPQLSHLMPSSSRLTSLSGSDGCQIRKKLECATPGSFFEYGALSLAKLHVCISPVGCNLYKSRDGSAEPAWDTVLSMSNQNCVHSSIWRITCTQAITRTVPIQRVHLKYWDGGVLHTLAHTRTDL